MKIGLISDIHSNLEALSVVLDALKENNCTEIICCGDIVGYGANPNECIKLLRSCNLKIVLGNHDAGVLNKTPLYYFNEVAQKAILWTRKELTRDSLEYLDLLFLVDHSYPFHIVHASPQAPGKWYYILSLPEAIHQFRFFEKPICVIGHTHIPLVVEELNNQYRIIEEDEFLIESGAHYLINVGSVGQPRDGDPRTTCCIYDTKKKLFKRMRLEYDIKSAAQKILEAGLPKVLSERLFYGR